MPRRVRDLGRGGWPSQRDVLFLRVHDDRGVERPAFRAGVRDEISSAEIGELQEELRREAGHSFVDLTRWGWIAFGALVVCVLVFVNVRGMARGTHTGWGLVVPCGMAAFVVWAWRTRRRRLPELDGVTVAASLAGRGRCGSCAYSLSGLPPEADGCTICPECGAAWRLA